MPTLVEGVRWHAPAEGPVQADGAAQASVRGLVAGYGPPGRGNAPVLRGVDLDVGGGELVVLVGPNGSGKTTLIRALTGGVRPWSGRVRLCGHDVASLSPREIARRAAVVEQDPALPDAFTALELVLMGRTPHLGLLQNEGSADAEAARRAMVATGVWALAVRPMRSLSGGERRRVVLARALAQEAPVLLLDEPTAHLDIGHQAAVLGLVRDLCRRQKKAALAVVHDLTLAAQYGDRLVLMAAGQVVAEGSAQEVLRPDLVGDVYGLRVHVFAHPATGKPVVAPFVGEG